MPPPDLTIREATPADAGRISALIASLARHFLADPERPQDAAAFFETITPSAIADSIASGRYRYHLAKARESWRGSPGCATRGTCIT